MNKTLTLYLILTAYISLAQNKTIDSLQVALNKIVGTKPELRQNLLSDEIDTTRVINLNDIGKSYILDSDCTSARKLAEDFISVVQQIGLRKGHAKFNSNIGLVYYSQGD